MKTFKEIAIEEGNKDKFWHVTYRGRTEGYFVIKAKTKADAEKYFEENKDEFFKNSSGIYIDYIGQADSDEEQYAINEAKQVWEIDDKHKDAWAKLKGGRIEVFPSKGKIETVIIDKKGNNKGTVEFKSLWDFADYLEDLKFKIKTNSANLISWVEEISGLEK